MKEKTLATAFLAALAIGLVATLVAMEGSQSYIPSSEVITESVLLIIAGCGVGIIVRYGDITRSRITRETTAVALMTIIVVSLVGIALPNAVNYVGITVRASPILSAASVGATIASIATIAIIRIRKRFNHTGPRPPGIFSSVKAVTSNGAGTEGRNARTAFDYLLRIFYLNP